MLLSLFLLRCLLACHSYAAKQDRAKSEYFFLQNFDSAVVVYPYVIVFTWEEFTPIVTLETLKVNTSSAYILVWRGDVYLQYGYIWVVA